MADGYLKRDVILRMMRQYDSQHLYEALLYTEDADVRKNIHGKWIELPKALDSNEKLCECSSCGHLLSFINGYPKSNFCPNCGADMRGDKAK